MLRSGGNVNVYDFKTGRLIDAPGTDVPEPAPGAVIVAHASDPRARALMQGAARSLRQRGIPAVARRDESDELGWRWMLVVLARDEGRAKAAFDEYLRRTNARRTRRH